MKLRVFTEPQQGASYSHLLGVAQAAERAGFDAFFRSDHFQRMGTHFTGLPGPTDAWITLAGIARETNTIRLGTLVNSATFRHPGVLAVSVANVDDMSNGRVELGLGAGWFLDEHRSYGVTFPPLGERFDILTEQLLVITGLWNTPHRDTFSFSGNHYTLTDSQLSSTCHFKTCRCSLRNVTVCVQRATAIGRDVEELKANGLCGTPGEVLEKIKAWEATGAEHLYLQMLDLSDLDQIALIGEHIIKHL